MELELCIWQVMLEGSTTCTWQMQFDMVTEQVPIKGTNCNNWDRWKVIWLNLYGDEIET